MLYSKQYVGQKVFIVSDFELLFGIVTFTTLENSAKIEEIKPSPPRVILGITRGKNAKMLSVFIAQV